MRLVILTAAFAAALIPASASDQPYAGLETRDIKALSQERIDGLLNGNGLSYALAAELNGLPGPRHVLDMADRLDLDSGQIAGIEAIFAEMNAEARKLGAELIAAEAQLDKAFASGSATAENVSELTAEIAAIEAHLRAAHLNAHLKTDPLLNRHQKHVYALERGYAGENAGHGTHSHN